MAQSAIAFHPLQAVVAMAATSVQPEAFGSAGSSTRELLSEAAPAAIEEGVVEDIKPLANQVSCQASSDCDVNAVDN